MAYFNNLGIRDHFIEGGKGGYRSYFTENKTSLSQFTKYITLAFHAPPKIKEKILKNQGSRRLWKLLFTRKKRAISHFTGNKKGRSRVTKILFTTLFIGVSYKKKHTSLRPCASVQRRNRLRAAEAGKMTSFTLNSGDHYVKSLNVFITKSGERSKNFELLEEHIPPLVQRSLDMGQQRSRLNILSVGSGSGVNRCGYLENSKARITEKRAWS